MKNTWKPRISLALIGMALIGMAGCLPGNDNPAGPSNPHDSVAVPDTTPPVAQTGWFVSKAAAASNDLGTQAAFYAVHFVGSSTGWIAGAGGLILKTSDGGATWSKQTTGTTQNLYAVQFKGTSLGWACGAAGVLLTTTNGGGTWISRATGTSNTLRSLHFPTAFVGYAVGDGNTLIKTTDGGVTWNTQGTGTSGYTFNAVRFVGPDTGWIAASSTLILATTNGGATWFPQYGPASSNSSFLTLSVTDGTHAWAAREGEVWRLQDGTWSVTPLTGLNISDKVYGTFFLNDSTGWAVGAKICRTANGGTSWSIVTTGKSSNATARAITFADAANGWFVTDYAGIYRTADSGRTWSALFVGGLAQNFQDLNTVRFADSLTGWAAGAGGAILKTTNGGITWSSKTTGVSATLAELDFVSPLTGWAVGDAGTVLKTTDGGETWHLLPSGTAEYIVSVDFLDSIQGLAVTRKGTQIKTTDGGATWSITTANKPSYTVNYASIRWLDPTTMVRSSAYNPNAASMGSYVIEISNDGGLTWVSVSSTYNYSYGHLFVQNGDTLFVADGGIARSIGRASLVQQPISSGYGIRDIHFGDKAVGWAVGAGGLILTTADGGYSGWTPVPSGTTLDLNGVYFVSAKHGWAVGKGGLILKYAVP